MRAGVLVSFLLAAACAGPQPEPVDPSAIETLAGELEARPTADGLELVNKGDAPVYYRARDPLTLALSDQIPCAMPTNCPSVPAGSRVTVAYGDAIAGYRPGTERALVHWWHFVQRGDGSVAADEVRTLEVELGGS